MFNTRLATSTPLVSLLLFAAASGAARPQGPAATANPVTTLSDGTWVHRGNSCPTVGLVPMIIAMGHSKPGSWENVSHWIEAADTYCFALAIPDFGNGIPDNDQGLNLLTGGPTTFRNTPAGGTRTLNSLGLVKWANQVGGNPHMVLGTGFSAGGGFWEKYLAVNAIDPPSFTIVAVAPVGALLSTDAFPKAQARTQPTAMFMLLGTAEAGGAIPWQGSSTAYSIAQQVGAMARVNGWDAVTAPTQTKPFAPWVIEFKYDTRGGPDAKYWLITAGTTPVQPSPERGGGIHAWPGAYGPQSSTPSAGDHAFHATDEVSRWFMSLAKR